MQEIVHNHNHKKSSYLFIFLFEDLLINAFVMSGIDSFILV